MNIQELHDANMALFKKLLNKASMNRTGITLINAQVELLIEHFSQEDAKDHFQNSVDKTNADIELLKMTANAEQERLKVEYLIRDLQRLSNWCLQNKFRVLSNDLIVSGVRGQIVQIIKKIETWSDWHNLDMEKQK
jgi:ribosome-binding ATPase YchF (GTP1/OBG family)